MIPRKRKLVRAHLSSNDPSLEGFYFGRRNGHYRLQSASLLEGTDKTYALEGKEIWIPASRVVFFQVLQ